MTQNPEEDCSTLPQEEPTFADMLESYSTKISGNIKPGNKISVRIIAVGKDSVFLDTGTQIDGVADKTALLDSKGEFSYKAGDSVELYVVSVKDDEILFSKALSSSIDNSQLKEAYQNAIPVQGKVTAQCKGGFNVDINSTRAFCPVSQIDISYVENPEIFIGKTFDFLILEFSDKGKNIVVSRRELLKQDQDEKKKIFLDKLSVDSIVTGRVTKIMPYGAFVELIPGIKGLVPISEISWSHVEKPEDVLKTDDCLQVIVTAVQPVKDGEPKISLSIKKILENPWDTIVGKIKAGDKVKGRITRIAPFGAFVEIAPGIDGLVHVSEISYAKRVNRIEDFLSAGETVHVLIKEIDVLKKRISLSIKDAEGDPWADVPEKFKCGQAMEGIIQKKEKWGFLVTLEPGIYGSLPFSEIRSQPKSLESSLKPGRVITVIIDEVNLHEKKIMLSLTDRENDNWKDHLPLKNDRDFEILSDKLKEALKNTKHKQD